MKLTTLILTASLGLATTTPAAILTLHETGVFGPTTTLNGVAFGVDTPFDFHATFDSTTDLYAVGGAGLFPIGSFSILLGSTPYTALPSPDLNAYLLDATATGYYIAGIAKPDLSRGFIGWFTAATPSFDADLPTPSVLSGFSKETSATPYTIALDGGAGDLVVYDIGAAAFTAELTDVPEPGQWAMMGMTLLGAGGFVLRQRRAKAAK